MVITVNLDNAYDIIIEQGILKRCAEEDKENARLRKENKDLKDALEILKKAIGILNR